jgi:ubiquinone/menaquinone biosynthesis C-methylase UbiE
LAAANLRDLKRLNRWTGGRRILDEILRSRTAGKRFSLLDVGAASGDVACAVRERFPGARVVSVDHQSFHLGGAPHPKVVADAFALPFRRRSFDFVFCSLLLHEYPDADVVRLLRRFHGVASKAVVALDLYRHPVAYHFLPATQRLFGWGELTVQDGPASVEAAFMPSELKSLAMRAGIKRVEVRRHLPWFRISMVGER